MSETQPFVFLGCLQLNELLAHEAHDARELLEQLERVPIESVFCHTSASLLHRPVLAEAYPNDFSLWVGTEVRDVREVRVPGIIGAGVGAAFQWAMAAAGGSLWAGGDEGNLYRVDSVETQNNAFVSAVSSAEARTWPLRFSSPSGI